MSLSGDGAGEAAAAGPPLLKVTGLTKRFGALTACDHIDFELRRGEVLALLGENGAGKSTLVKMLYGALAPDEGTIAWNGAPVTIATPAQARTLGIGMVFQHFSLFEALSVVENIALALPPQNRKALAEKIRSVSRDYGLPLDPYANVSELSVGERQRVEIVRCLLQDPRLLIMDEPTSVLTPQESDILFRTLRRLSGEGVAILYITHRLSEVLALAGRATILRRGKVVGTADPKRETAASLAALMVGSEIRPVERAKPAHLPATPRLLLDGLSMDSDSSYGARLSEIALQVRAGEIVGIAGVAGNGQQELFDAISGERLADRPEAVRIDGAPVGREGVNARRMRGAAFVPEERSGHGAVGSFRLSENVVLTRHGTGEEICQRGILNRAAARDVEARVGERFDVRRSGADPKASSLSGGNLQKFVVGREIDRKPAVLVVNQPTWGVDAGAARTIREALIELARGGSAVLVISQDLDELFEISDRMAVMSEGRLSETYDVSDLTAEKVGMLMGGVHQAHAGVADAEAAHAS